VPHAPTDNSLNYVTHSFKGTAFPNGSAFCLEPSKNKKYNIVVNRKYLEWGANPFCQVYSAPPAVILVHAVLSEKKALLYITCHNSDLRFKGLIMTVSYLHFCTVDQ
jgi:hypothetical protein